MQETEALSSQPLWAFIEDTEPKMLNDLHTHTASTCRAGASVGLSDKALSSGLHSRMPRGDCGPPAQPWHLFYSLNT
jgi:hypothetical protein